MADNVRRVHVQWSLNTLEPVEVCQAENLQKFNCKNLQLKT